jgi:hypothetical protein
MVEGGAEVILVEGAQGEHFGDGMILAADKREP